MAEDAELVQVNDPYFQQSQQALQRILAQQRNTNQAKNVILVVGDGMGFSTVTAARIYEGQQRGVDGESNVLAWEASSPHLEDLLLRRADHRFAERRGDDHGREDQERHHGPRPHGRARELRGPEDQAGDHALGAGETIGMSTGAVTTATITRDAGRHLPTLPAGIGRIPTCRPRRSRPAAPTSPAS